METCQPVVAPAAILNPVGIAPMGGKTSSSSRMSTVASLGAPWPRPGESAERTTLKLSGGSATESFTIVIAIVLSKLSPTPQVTVPVFEI